MIAKKILLLAVLALLVTEGWTQQITDEAADVINELKKKYPIKKIIVLMMENRSFDHVFGWMTRGGEWGDERVEGLYGSECNPKLVRFPMLGQHCVNDKAEDVCDDPEHGHVETTEQIFGCKSHYKHKHKSTPYVKGHEDNPCVSHASITGEPKMTGFSDNSIRHFHKNFGANELTMWKPEKVPIITTLAKEFASFDRFFCSYPGPTDPNRMFMHSGTAYGVANTGECRSQDCAPQKTIFRLLEENGMNWKFYYEDNMLDWFLYMKDLNQTFIKPNQTNIVQMENFYDDVANNRLPEYTFINPSESVQKDKWNKTHNWGLPNDQHPPHSMMEGERLIKNVYEALRNSSFWNETLFVLNYDEHGGFYDHVSPPQDGVPNPDGLMNKYGFNYTRLGIRTPFILISPWIEKGQLIHEPKPHQKPFNTSEWEHCSVLSSMQKIFGIEDQVMTERTRWAATFDDMLLVRDTPRTDCPEKLPDLPDPTPEKAQFYYDMPVNEDKLKKASYYCQYTAPENPDCHKWIKTQADYGAFLREHDRIYTEKYVKSAHEEED